MKTNIDLENFGLRTHFLGTPDVTPSSGRFYRFASVSQKTLYSIGTEWVNSLILFSPWLVHEELYQKPS